MDNVSRLVALADDGGGEIHGEPLDRACPAGAPGPRRFPRMAAARERYRRVSGLRLRRAARLAVFVDGCFWHGCPSCHRPPSSNQEYWTKKVARNRRRDRRNSRLLRQDGWTVLRVWEHALRDPQAVVAEIRGMMRSGNDLV